MLAYGRKKPSLGLWHETPHHNLDKTDLKMLHGYFIDYGCENVERQQRAATEKGQGVIVYCDADMTSLNKTRYKAVEVPITHAIFQNRQTQRSQIAQRIGLPLLARNMTRKLQDPEGAGNSEMTALRCQCEEPTATSTSSPMDWVGRPHTGDSIAKALLLSVTTNNHYRARSWKTLQLVHSEFHPLFGSAYESLFTHEYVRRRITSMAFQRYKDERVAMQDGVETLSPADSITEAGRG